MSSSRKARSAPAGSNSHTGTGSEDDVQKPRKSMNDRTLAAHLENKSIVDVQRKQANVLRDIRNTLNNRPSKRDLNRVARHLDTVADSLDTSTDAIDINTKVSACPTGLPHIDYIHRRKRVEVAEARTAKSIANTSLESNEDCCVSGRKSSDLLELEAFNAKRKAEDNPPSGPLHKRRSPDADTKEHAYREPANGMFFKNKLEFLESVMAFEGNTRSCVRS